MSDKPTVKFNMNSYLTVTLTKEGAHRLNHPTVEHLGKEPVLVIEGYELKKHERGYYREGDKFTEIGWQLLEMLPSMGMGPSYWLAEMEIEA